MAISDIAPAAVPVTWLAPQSVVMAQALRYRGVRVDTLFFPPEQEPKLAHEYQFDLDSSPGREALERLTAFLDRVAHEGQVGAGIGVATWG
ncbi:MAG: hypothetical protein Q8S58_15550 [Bosea sp. (in: a-proteobacteria)]|uniref:hypothetical protein n=1 Tax=Bosea sp. (in: a-proteobacteria) TaxID=1871050 RepID=UPI002733DE8C|nr:hypothetical protein [Bosea sp. (in: a-proteobacteria)]MDP3258408.1 hypothetical protein [Bosea sp. (in: a-proteobacteria)]MDP3320537.1 hypothetical protein [Bosea sp. (in: a-proteobacteria)]